MHYDYHCRRSKKAERRSRTIPAGLVFAGWFQADCRGFAGSSVGIAWIATDTAQIVLMDGSLSHLSYLFQLAQYLSANMKTTQSLAAFSFCILSSSILFNLSLVAGVTNASDLCSNANQQTPPQKAEAMKPSHRHPDSLRRQRVGTARSLSGARRCVLCLSAGAIGGTTVERGLSR